MGVSDLEPGSIERRPLSLPAYPIRTVTAEREVQAMTEASATVLMHIKASSHPRGNTAASFQDAVRAVKPARARCVDQMEWDGMRSAMT